MIWLYVDFRTNRKLIYYGKGKPDGKPRSDTTWWVTGDGIPDGPIFRQVGVEITIDLAEARHTIDSASNQHDPNPAIAAPRLLWLSTMHNTVDLATKASPCLRIEEHKQEYGRCKLELQIKRIKHTTLGSTNRSILHGKTV